MEKDNGTIENNNENDNLVEKNASEEIKNEKIEKDEIKEIDNEEDIINEENKEEQPKEEVVEENKKDEKQVKKTQEELVKEILKRKKKIKKLIILITSIICFLLFISTIFAILNIDNNNIINGVYIEDVNLSNLEVENATQLINDRLNLIDEIEFVDGEYSTIIKTDDIGITVNARNAIIDAINIGKTKNILIDNYVILKTNLFKTKLKLEINIDETKLEETIKNIQAELPNAIKEYTYEIDGDKLIITNGIKGKAIDKEEFKKYIIENIKKQFNGEPNKLSLPLATKEPAKIDLDKIYKEIYKEAQDAYIVEEPFELHKDEDGIDFDITMEEAQELLKENKAEYEIPLKITEADTKVKDLGDKLFKQTLSKYTTIYDAGNKNRASNIALASKTINDIVLLPGEVFSYNGTLGNTTKEKGYKQGGAYVGGKVVQAYGGGICQVSTTLYNAVLYANLEIVERYNHSYPVSYVPAGRDATVAYGGKDFKFKNSRKYPIKISANAKNGVVSICILGIKEGEEDEIVLTSTVLGTTPFSVVYEKTSLLQEGTEKIIQKGCNGQKSIAYKIIKRNGKTISKTVLSKDTYKPMNRIIQIGTKK